MLRGVEVLRRIVQSPVITSTRRVIKNAFNKHLFATNVTISFTLSGLGDVLQQQHNIVRQRQHSWDRARTRHMTCTGVTVGALCHHWYLLLDRRLPGRSMAVVLKKLLVDQLLFSPLCLTVFFLSLGVFRGGGVNEFVSDVQQKGWRLYVAECLVWPPAQLVNFYLLPTKFRVLYDNSISLMFDIYTSHVCYDRETPEDD
ncbi:mpv17-like protein 2 [Eriocheir sinensis]|uniref:mpv17-like protein 2 n=1 Tax=Eriocheir sinensis TaxID=95602 RepID=UPI0021C88B63|nr:mpv17-like protein 2 [Eriocheir sinensis]